MNVPVFAGPGCHTERSGGLREQFEGPAPEQDAPSIVTFLLLKKQVTIPDMPAREHRIETPEDADSFDHMSDLIRRKVSTRLANVETVFATLQSGASTINEVIKITGLGKKVAQRAMTALENDRRIVRFTPNAANQSHRFMVVIDNAKVTGAAPTNGERSDDL